MIKEKVETHLTETAEGLQRSFGANQWLADTIFTMRKDLKSIAFYRKMARSARLSDFSWVRQLYYHSREFPQILAKRYADCREDKLKDFMLEHVRVEDGHSDMLLGWMLENKFLRAGEDYRETPATLGTIGCISYGWRLVSTESVHAQLIGLNVATECASWDFFSFVTPKLEKLGKCHDYWRVHVVADQFHSADALTHLPEIAPGSEEGRTLVRVARESFLVWGLMLNSWVGVEEIPSIPSIPSQ